MPTFHISVFLRGFLLTSSDLRESGKLWQLGGNAFLRVSRLYFKTLQSFACLTLPEKRDKGVISEILMRSLPQTMIFSPKISIKFWHQLSLEINKIHKFGFNSRSASPYLCESGKFSLKLHFELWQVPFLRRRSKYGF